MKPKVSIIIPTLNSSDLLDQCLKSIKEHTDESLYELILIDNGHSKENHDVWKKYYIKNWVYTDFTPIPTVTESWNKGIKMSTADILLFMNDDILVCPQWLDYLLAVMENNQIACLFPDSVGGQGKHAFRHSIFTGIDDWKVEAQKRLKEDTRVRAERMNGHCFMVARQTFKTVGIFDETFKVWYQDTDFEVRLLQHEELVAQLDNVLIYHHESVTLDKNWGDVAPQIKLDKIAFDKKYEGTDYAVYG